MDKTVAELLKALVAEINNVRSNTVPLEPIYEKYETLILRKLERALAKAERQQ